MPRDQRWPIAWTMVLMSIHLVAAIALLGISASLMSQYTYTFAYIWSSWSVSQASVSIVATIVHIVCVCAAKLNPAWTLSFYLVLWLGWVAMASLAGIWYSSYGYDNGYYSYDYYYGYSWTSDSYSYLNLPLRLAELVLISIVSASGMALWIFCCVIVNRWRQERAILIARGSQQPPIQYVNITYAGYPPGHPLHQPLDPNNKVPLSTSHYSMPPGDPNMIQYPYPAQSPPQNYGHYAPPQPIQSPVQLPNSVPQFQPPPQDQIQYPAPVQSPVPSRKPVSPSNESDQYPTYFNNHPPN